MEARKQELIAALRSKDDKQTRQALTTLRQHGWLMDGSLAEVALHGAHLAGLDLRSANLQGATLSGVDLRGADLRGADLSHTDLIDANLSGANLSNASLSGADLIAAKLSGANLTNADLTEAALGGTKLNYAIFHHTVLTQASFNNAICDNTLFVDVDLSEVGELASVRHFGPSEIGVRTLYKSRGQIPADFLRGCGLPESAINAIPDLTDEAGAYHACFISYSYPDRFFAQHLQNALQAQGIRCWLDEHQIRRNVDFYEVLNRATRLEHKIVLCCSHTALNSWWIKDEVEMALRKEKASAQGKPSQILIALTIDDCLDGENNPAQTVQPIQRRLVADFGGTQQDQAGFERELDKILQALWREGHG